MRKKPQKKLRRWPKPILPALDDQFVQSLGYESAEKFSEALRANIKNEKELQEIQKAPRRQFSTSS